MQCKIESLQILDLRRLAVMLFSVSSGDETVHVILNILHEILKCDTLDGYFQQNQSCDDC